MWGRPYPCQSSASARGFWNPTSGMWSCLREEVGVTCCGNGRVRHLGVRLCPETDLIGQLGCWKPKGLAREGRPGRVKRRGGVRRSRAGTPGSEPRDLLDGAVFRGRGIGLRRLNAPFPGDDLEQVGHVTRTRRAKESCSGNSASMTAGRGSSLWVRLRWARASAPLPAGEPPARVPGAPSSSPSEAEGRACQPPPDRPVRTQPRSGRTHRLPPCVPPESGRRLLCPPALPLRW